jgi:hypothetical protein
VSDTYKTVYCAPDIDAFLMIVPDAKARPGSWVATKTDGGLAIEPYNGQRYHGVVRFLNFWRFEHSEQQRREKQRPKDEKKPRPKVHRQPRRRVYWPRQIAC